MLATKRAARGLAAPRSLKGNKPLVKLGLLPRNYLKLILSNLGLMLLLTGQIGSKIASFSAAGSYFRAFAGSSIINSSS